MEGSRNQPVTSLSLEHLSWLLLHPVVGSDELDGASVSRTRTMTRGGLGLDLMYFFLFCLKACGDETGCRTLHGS